MVAVAADTMVAEEEHQRMHLRSLSSLEQVNCPVVTTDNAVVAIDLILVVFVLH